MKKMCIRDRYGIKDIYEDLEAMLNREDIDFVYVASPNSLHFQYSLQAVSYTHLDVYKRQDHDCFQRKDTHLFPCQHLIDALFIKFSITCIQQYRCV